jgi:hypothetical protein
VVVTTTFPGVKEENLQPIAQFKNSRNFTSIFSCGVSLTLGNRNYP